MNPAMLYFSAAAFVFGTMIGSFLNVVVWRVPRGESIRYPGSHCPKCGHVIRPWENIPIFSWLALRGRCSGCHQPISWKYPVGEAAIGALYLGIFLNVHLSGLHYATLLGWWWFAGAMLSAARIDAEKGIIPNMITYSGCIAALAMAIVAPMGRAELHAIAPMRFGGLLAERIGLANGEWLVESAKGCGSALVGIAVGWLSLGVLDWIVTAWLRRKKPEHPAAIGGGDIKLMMMIGAFLGCEAVLYILAGGAFLAFAWGIIRTGMAAQKKKESAAAASQMVPLAPFLAVPALLWVVYGNWMELLFRWVTKS